MPSIKSCLASIALLAMTVAPMVSAKGVHADALAGRDVAGHMARSVASPQANANMDKRAAAKAAAAKRALARREAKAAAEPARVPVKVTSGGTAGATTLSDGATISSYTAGSAFMIAAAAKTGNRRCGTSDLPCQAYLTVANGKLPANATPKCISAMCTYRCNDGYGPFGDGTCQPDTMCGNTACADVSGGYNTCVNGACTPGCYSGASLYSNTNGQYACYNTLTDAQHCGPVGATVLTQCTATSYNGKGTPACINGACGLSCPPYRHQYPAQSVTHPYLCA